MKKVLIDRELLENIKAEMADTNPKAYAALTRAIEQAPSQCVVMEGGKIKLVEKG